MNQLNGRISMDTEMQEIALSNLKDELDGAYLYDALAQVEKDTRLAEVYRRMAAVERKHAAVWVERLKAAKVEPPAFTPNWRTRTLAWTAKRLGVAAVLPTITGLEQKDTRKYAFTPDAAEMAADEHSHARLLQQV